MKKSTLTLLALLLALHSHGQEFMEIYPDQSQQTVVGFGASLAYYDNWLYNHPHKGEIYEAIFGELSLDLLRVRNAHVYEPDMIDRVSAYMQAAEAVLGHPIKLYSTSWGPPGSLKNTGDRKNGGTLRYDIVEGELRFDYAGFASWWMSSLDEYAAHGIMPDYITIQNEPNYSDTWETCRFDPTEKINRSDTVAGYDVALQVVSDSLAARGYDPLVLGPEPAGIGYNNVQNYIWALDTDLLDGISHHLYNGVDENDPWASSNFAALGEFHPELPHFQTEYSLGDWFSLAGLIYKSFKEEKVVSYMYWDLIWSGGGLVSLENPWSSGAWTSPKGYERTRDFYAFKQFSAFIHPGWKMVDHSPISQEVSTLSFASPSADSVVCVLINRSQSAAREVHIDLGEYRVDSSGVYVTSAVEECSWKGEMRGDSIVVLGPRSITTLDMHIELYDPAKDQEAPTDPSAPVLLRAWDTSFRVAWEAATDDVGVRHYEVYLDGALYGTTGDTSFIVDGLQVETEYRISLLATDLPGNRSGMSSELVVSTIYLDRMPPELQAADSLYQEGGLPLQSSEEGWVYLVKHGTPGELEAIVAAALDSLEVEANVPTVFPVEGLENGIYVCYARDSAYNLSAPGYFRLYGVGMTERPFVRYRLFPNPMESEAILELALEREAPLIIQLLDLSGRLLREVYRGDPVSGSIRVPITRDGLSPGSYVLRISAAGTGEVSLLLNVEN